MALSLQIAKSISVLGKTFGFSRALAPDGVTAREPALPPAKVGSLSTRTNGSAGVLTMVAGHGFANNDVLDIYFSGGVAYKATIGASGMSGDNATFTGALGNTGTSGQALPAVNTAVTAMKVNKETGFNVIANNLQALACYAAGIKMVARFVQANDADVTAVVVNPGAEGYVWFKDDPTGAANPFGADVASVYLTHESSAATVSPMAYAVVN